MRLSETAKSIITLLNNINDLIVISSDRQNAQKVMRALVVYADNKKFQIPKERIENFSAVLLDARPYTLTSIIKDIVEDVVIVDGKNQKKKD